MEENMKEIIESLRKEECVLVLGPQAATYEGRLLQDLLVADMAQNLGLPENMSYDLSQLAWKIKKVNDQFDAQRQFKKLLGNFYANYKDKKIPIYEIVSKLPFKCILNCSPDKLILESLLKQDKKALFYSYHFKSSLYNERVHNDVVDLEIEFSRKTPLVYNLFGNYEDPTSLVLTDEDRLKFIENILSKESIKPPNSISINFLGTIPDTMPPKTYLFVGFDFNDWYMRLLMHWLRRDDQDRELSPCLQNQEQLQDETVFFYTEIYKMFFVPQEPLSLLEGLHQQLILTKAPVNNPAGMELVILYHSKDENLRVDLEKYIAPLERDGLVCIWHEGLIQAGQDRDSEIELHLASANIILALVTVNLLADSSFNGVHQGIALRRHENNEAKLIPLKLSPCDMTNSPLLELNTLYPRDKNEAVSQAADREKTLTNFVHELREIVERMHKNQLPDHE